MEIILPLEKTELHKQLDVLIRRYTNNDRAAHELKDHYRRIEAGYKGECQLEYYLHLSNLQPAYSLAGLRLKQDKHHFQIDRMLLIPSGCFIIEVKHMTGKLSFNNNGQLIQKLHDQEFSYNNPYTQVQLQEKQLRHILNQRGFKDFPIHPLVVFTHQDSILDLGSNPNLISVQHLTFKIDQLIKQYSARRNISDIHRLALFLKEAHVPKKDDVFNRFNIDLSRIKTGVFCTSCLKGMMSRIHGSWLCRACQKKDQLAHITALNDYKTLFGNFISKKEASWFLSVASPDTMYRILNNLNIPTVGNNRSTRYDLNHLS